MAIIIHLFIAFASLVYTGYLFFKPTPRGLRLSYGLIVATLLSGTYLVASSGAHMLQACASGLVYLCIISIGTVAVRARLGINAG